MWLEFRYALRRLLKEPGFAIAAVATLALGIGVTTAIFSVVNAVLLRALPYQDPERLVMVWETNPKLNIGVGFPELPVSAPIFLGWRRLNGCFERMAAFQGATVNLIGVDEPERLSAARVSPDLFPLLGVRPLLGRTFLPEEEQPGGDDVVLLSHSLWQRRFGSSPDIVGKTVNLDSRSRRVIGILPPGFHFPRGGEHPTRSGARPPTEVWRPLVFTPEQARNFGNHAYSVIGKLKKQPLASAQAEMAAIEQRILEPAGGAQAGDS